MKWSRVFYAAPFTQYNLSVTANPVKKNIYQKKTKYILGFKLPPIDVDNPQSFDFITSIPNQIKNPSEKPNSILSEKEFMCKDISVQTNVISFRKKCFSLF